MPDESNQRIVAAHYGTFGSGSLISAIEQTLLGAGIDPQQVTVEQLAPLDNFHSFGPAGTMELARLAGVRAEDRVLDAGGGVGGPARLLATRFGCTVTVLDLTEAFCQAGEALSAWTHLSNRVSFVVGNALEMPFADGSFDSVWTQHAAMNIEDKARLYAEAHRVLRPGGRLALFDIFAGPTQPMFFPVPWATDARSSFLVTPEEARTLATGAGFVERAWLGTEEIQARMEQAAGPQPALSQLSPAVLMGAEAGVRMANIQRNTREGRVALGMGVFERVS